MSEYPEALETRIATALYEHTNPHIGDRRDYFRADARAVIDALGLREERRSQALYVNSGGKVVVKNGVLRYVTEWESS